MAEIQTTQEQIDGWRNQISMASNTVGLSADITNEEFRALLEDHATLQARVLELEQENAALRAQVERLTEHLERIEDWCRAYPIDVFPDPDLTKCRELLGDGQFTRLNAHAMRHVVNGIALIAERAKEKA